MGMVALVRNTTKRMVMYLSMKTAIKGAVALGLVSSLMLMASPAQASTINSASVPSQAQRAAKAAPLSAPVTGSFTDAAGKQGVFAGTFTPTRFASSHRQVIAIGTLTGTLTDAAGTSLGTVTKTISSPLATGHGTNALAAASCQILDLRIQPIDLNLLGLVVHLDTVHLIITAQSGPGNLLGNLLCAVAGLLNSGGLGATLSALLNQILAILNGLGL